MVSHSVVTQATASSQAKRKPRRSREFGTSLMASASSIPSYSSSRTTFGAGNNTNRRVQPTKIPRRPNNQGLPSSVAAKARVEAAHQMFDRF